MSISDALSFRLWGLWRITLAAACMTVSGCSGAEEPGPASADRAAFERAVLPVLIADCSFHTCHGSTARFFQVFGPGHGRLDQMTKAIDPITPAEVERSYVRALSMIDAGARAKSLLLVKPLATAAGGASHEGADSLGRNVYQSASDPHYAVLRAWVLGKPLPP